MSAIKLSDRISLTTERAESSYGIPVLVIDGTAYGRDDAWTQPLRDAQKSGDEFDRLIDMCTGEQSLVQLARSVGGIEAVKAFLGVIATTHGWLRPEEIRS